MTIIGKIPRLLSSPRSSKKSFYPKFFNSVPKLFWLPKSIPGSPKNPSS
jgi:hypothetical protein